MVDSCGPQTSQPEGTGSVSAASEDFSELGFDQRIRSPHLLIPDPTGASAEVARFSELARTRALTLHALPEPTISFHDVLATLEAFPLPEHHHEDVVRVRQAGALVDILAFAVAEALAEVAFGDRVEITFRLLEALAAGAETPSNKASPAPRYEKNDVRRSANVPALDWPTRDRVEKRVREISPRERWDFADANGDFPRLHR